MTIKESLREEFKKALKEKSALRLSTFRLLMAAIANKEIELLKKTEGLSEEEALRVLQGESKKRRDAIEEFRRAKREDRALQEQAELEVIQEFLPKELSDDELALFVRGAVQETTAADMKSFGAVMKAVMPKIAGRASGDRVSAAVKSILSK